ncbi:MULTISPECIES: methyltransferase [Actinomadura]|uniref:Methyltransferase n=1 Tax=Actinomadura yumaensis TaxID=111807 RepID=A0ABW2CKL9_9ACTN|nr:methyltransferase [Actinomadura sp. J1-007]
MPEPSQDPVSAQVDRLAIGAALVQAVHAAARFGVADELAAGPRPVEELAAAVGADGPALYRLMRALAAAEVFEELDGRRFALAPLGALLREGAPGSIRDWALAVGRPLYRDAWTRLPDSIRTGEPAFETLHGRTMFEHFGDHPEEARAFDAMMAASAGRLVAPIVRAYDFGRSGTVVDVGGGNGALLSAILAANPGVRGVLYDLPHVVAAAEPGLNGRCRCVGGDFLDSVPSGGDVYLLAHVIHDWDDDRAARILTNCRAALRGGAGGGAGGGRVVLAEWVLPDGPGGGGSALAAWTDLSMLVMTPGGRQRTRSDFERLLGRAGLRLSRVVPTESECALVEAVPA